MTQAAVIASPVQAAPPLVAGGRRRAALLGGTTNLGDVLAAVGYLAHPARLVDGPAIAAYERAFARRVGVRFGISFAAGRVGLFGILHALGIGAGDEVLLQVPTHIVVPNAIRYAGAAPVYVDCELDSYNMDLADAERRITPRTRAIVLQHTFGIPADLDAVLDLARRNGLLVIEDCVHALGARYAGRPVGSFGCAAFFSSEETKTISTTMGGMVVTDDHALATRLRAFQQACAPPPMGLTARYVLKLAAYHVLTQPRLHRYTRALYEAAGRRHPLPRPTAATELRGGRPAGYARRFSNAQAALGLRQLARLDANLAHRRMLADHYCRRLQACGLPVPVHPTPAEPAFVRYPMWVPDRAAAARAAAPHAVLGTWFTSVLEEAESPAAGAYRSGTCPRAEAAARHLVNLPTHPRVTVADADAIVAAVVTAARDSRS